MSFQTDSKEFRKLIREYTADTPVAQANTVPHRASAGARCHEGSAARLSVPHMTAIRGFTGAHSAA